MPYNLNAHFSKIMIRVRIKLLQFFVKHRAVKLCMDFCTSLSRISVNQEHNLHRTNTVLSHKKPVEL
jgi:hypothetical protein